jgi:hypothetical protein
LAYILRLQHRDLHHEFGLGICKAGGADRSDLGAGNMLAKKRQLSTRVCSGSCWTRGTGDPDRPEQFDTSRPQLLRGQRRMSAKAGREQLINTLAQKPPPFGYP